MLIMELVEAAEDETGGLESGVGIGVGLMWKGDISSRCGSFQRMIAIGKRFPTLEIDIQGPDTGRAAVVDKSPRDARDLDALSAPVRQCKESFTYCKCEFTISCKPAKYGLFIASFINVKSMYLHQYAPLFLY
jgi:hypothetical protein